MKHFFLIASLATLVLNILSNASAQAQEQTPVDLEPVELPPVSVQGMSMPPGSLTQPTPEFQEEELQSIPGGTNLIDKTQYSVGKTSNLQDVLQGQPGIFVGSRGGDEVKLSIRGSGVDRNFHLRGIKLLQDGIPFNQADGNADFQWLEPLSYQNVEVYRGGNALQYGSTTLGGAINFVSPTGYTAPRFQTRVETGSRGYIKGQISSGGVLGKWDYYLSATSSYQNGYQMHNRSSSQRYMGNIGYRFSDKLETRFFGGFVDSKLQLPDPLTKSELFNNPRKASPNALDFDAQHNVRYYYLANKTSYRLSETQQLDSSVYWIHNKLDHPLFWNQFFLNGLGYLDYQTNTYGANFKYTNNHDVFGRKNSFIAGFNPQMSFADTKRFQNVSGNKGLQTSNGGEFYANFDFYAENQHHLLKKLSLLTGTQLSYAVRNYNDRFDSNPNGSQTRNQDYWGFSPKVGLLYQVLPTAQVYANFSRSFEPPTSLEIIRTGGIAGNLLSADMKAQTGSTVEIGTRGALRRLSWDTTFYHSWIRNELLTLNDPLGNPLGTINASRTNHRGIEAAASLVLAKGIFAKKSSHDNFTALASLGPGLKPKTEQGYDRLVWRQVYNWTSLRFEGDPVYGQNRLPGLAPHVYRSELLYEHPSGFYIQPNVEWVMGKYAVDYANTLNASPYAVLNLRTGYRSKKGWSAFVEFRNMSNKRYASSVQVVADARGTNPRVFSPGIGFSVYGGVEFRW